MYGQQSETGAQRRRIVSIGGGGGADAWPFPWRFLFFRQKSAVLRGAGHADKGKRRDFLEIASQTLRKFLIRRTISPVSPYPPPGKKKIGREIGHRQRAKRLQRGPSKNQGGPPVTLQKIFIHYSLNIITVRTSSQHHKLEGFFIITQITGITEK